MNMNIHFENIDVILGSGIILRSDLAKTNGYDYVITFYTKMYSNVNTFYLEDKLVDFINNYDVKLFATPYPTHKFIHVSKYSISHITDDLKTVVFDRWCHFFIKDKKLYSKIKLLGRLP